MRFIFFSIYFYFFFTPCFSQIAVTKPAGLENSSRIILMQNTEFRKMVDFKGNRIFKQEGPLPAVIIQNRKQIINLAHSFDNRKLGYTYIGEGSQYNCYFISGNKKLSFTFDTIQQIDNTEKNFVDSINPFLKILIATPTHYTYNVEVPSYTAPGEAINWLNQSGYEVFQLDWEKEFARPFVSIKYEITIPVKNGNRYLSEEIKDSKLDSLESKILQAIRTKYPVSFTKERGSTYSTNVGDVFRKNEIEVYFNYGTDLKEIKDFLHNQNVIVEKIYSPDSYFLQLFHKSSSLDVVKKEVMQKSSLVLDVIEFH